MVKVLLSVSDEALVAEVKVLILAVKIQLVRRVLRARVCLDLIDSL